MTGDAGDDSLVSPSESGPHSPDRATGLGTRGISDWIHAESGRRVTSALALGVALGLLLLRGARRR